jgi:hypothetical protein
MFWRPGSTNRAKAPMIAPITIAMMMLEAVMSTPLSKGIVR